MTGISGGSGDDVICVAVCSLSRTIHLNIHHVTSLYHAWMNETLVDRSS